MTLLPQSKLDEIRERAEKATKGPWTVTLYFDKSREVYDRIWGPAVLSTIKAIERHENKEFIAHSRTDIPALLDMIEELQKKIGEIQTMVNEQAEDPGLWSFPMDRPQYISEAHLQQELRRLHRVIEETREIRGEGCI